MKLNRSKVRWWNYHIIINFRNSSFLLWPKSSDRNLFTQTRRSTLLCNTCYKVQVETWKKAQVEDENRRLLSSFKKMTNYLTRQIFPKLCFLKKKVWMTNEAENLIICQILHCWFSKLLARDVASMNNFMFPRTAKPEYMNLVNTYVTHRYTIYIGTEELKHV